jgi:acetyl-CoA carboxylase, biotin carboxylase subunit
MLRNRMAQRKIKKLLIANRGEIALRVIRACRELGIVSVAVFSDVDRSCLHVIAADEAYPLGGSTPKESYLNQAKILEAATKASVDAIHPGYGFLAENPEFAEAVAKNGIIFVGPSGPAIRRLGDKTEARKAAKSLDIPTISGTLEPIQSVQEGLRAAQAIGFPVLLKAAAGGGGKGMRVVRTAEEFESALRAAQSEAKGAFGDDRVYLEKYLEAPRHIEMQIIADSHGNVVYLGERECSIQRRHQKVIEESPSVAVDGVLRQRLGQAAVALAKSAKYVNAGTLEFLLDSAGNFFFLEMNTRLQVEHPVTEAVTGLDLVHLQIKIAEGEVLPIKQEDVRLSGHAIECRICAEDPENSFMPSTGILETYHPPQGNVRVENGFRKGDEISVFYDSLMAKVITWGPSRSAAIASMDRALQEFSVEGVKTTIPFCRFILEHEKFVEGNINTRFIDNNFSGMPSNGDGTAQSIAAAVAAVLIHSRAKAQTEILTHNGQVSRWKTSRREGHR